MTWLSVRNSVLYDIFSHDHMRLIEGDDEQLQVYNEDFALALMCTGRNSSTKILSSRERSTKYDMIYG